MYIPPNAINMGTIKFPQIKLGVQGDSGTGKSFLGQHFPNPIYADADGNLNRLAGNNKLHVVPLHSAEFLETYAGGKFKAQKPMPEGMPNVKDAVIHFLYNDARKMTAEQTLIWDSWSSIMDNLNNWYCANPVMVRKDDGSYAEDTRKMYAEYKDYATVFFTGMKALKCHVIVTFHEWKPRDKITGNVIEDKIAPLMEGSYKDQIKKNFTDFFRTSTKDGKFLMQVKSDKRFEAVTRASIKPKDLVDNVHYDITEPKTAWSFFEEAFKQQTTT